MLIVMNLISTPCVSQNMPKFAFAKISPQKAGVLILYEIEMSACQ
jgi:hypothetical protein